MKFSWDPRKAAANLGKHGVSFEEALTVFRDPLAHIHDDPDHSIGEWREIIIGTSAAGRLILISFTERGETIRVINAREPDRAERYDYEENI
ncbi:MAG TPA: BrnT family toxin [Thermoanaerobaculia bacterium]|nr:BrnT family toxin [Thermoanaerobaculia bacterium]